MCLGRHQVSYDHRQPLGRLSLFTRSFFPSRFERDSEDSGGCGRNVRLLPKRIASQHMERPAHMTTRNLGYDTCYLGY